MTVKINKLPIDGNGNIAIQDVSNSTINISNVPDEINISSKICIHG